MRPRGFTMVEAVLSLVLISGVAVALLTSMRTAARAGMVAHRQQFGTELAMDILAEVLATPYDTSITEVGLEAVAVDPLVPASSVAVAVGSDRLAKANTMSFNGVNEASVVTKSGQPVPNATGWRRAITVRYADTSNININPGADTGLALVTVIVMYNGGEVARASALRSHAWDDLMNGVGLGQ